MKDEQEHKGRIFEVTAKILLSMHAVLITTVLVFIIIIHFTTAIKGVNRKKVLPILMWVNVGLLVLTLPATMFFRPNLGEYPGYTPFPDAEISRRAALFAGIGGLAIAFSAVVAYGYPVTDVSVVVAVAFSGILVPFTLYNIINP